MEEWWVLMKDGALFTARVPLGFDPDQAVAYLGLRAFEVASAALVRL